MPRPMCFRVLASRGIAASLAGIFRKPTTSISNSPTISPGSKRYPGHQGGRRSQAPVFLGGATGGHGRELHFRSAGDAQSGGSGRREWRCEPVARHPEQLFSDREQRQVRLHLALQRLVHSGPMETEPPADHRLRPALGIYPTARRATQSPIDFRSSSPNNSSSPV